MRRGFISSAMAAIFFSRSAWRSAVAAGFAAVAGFFCAKAETVSSRRTASVRMDMRGMINQRSARDFKIGDHGQVVTSDARFLGVVNLEVDKVHELIKVDVVEVHEGHDTG